MLLAEVTGRLWSERQVAALETRRLVTTRPLDGEETLVAVDLVDVAAGNVVLVATDEAAQAAAGGEGGVDAAVVALVAGADAFELPRLAGAGA